MIDTKLNKSLSSVLGIDPIPEEKKEIEIIPPEKEPENSVSEDVKTDYDLSRKTFKKLISKGESAIEDLAELAKASEHPRSYEVLATLIKTVADTTKDLYDLQKKTKDLRDTKGKVRSGTIEVDKAVFVGNPSDLLKKIKEEE